MKTLREALRLFMFRWFGYYPPRITYGVTTMRKCTCDGPFEIETDTILGYCSTCPGIKPLRP